MVDCNAFDLKHTVYVVDEQSNFKLNTAASIPVGQIAEYAAASAVDCIKIQGITEYNEGIKEQIEKDLALKYANKNIKVEVI